MEFVNPIPLLEPLCISYVETSNQPGFDMDAFGWECANCPGTVCQAILSLSDSMFALR